MKTRNIPSLYLRYIIGILFIFILWNKFLDLQLYFSYFDSSVVDELIDDMRSIDKLEENLENYYKNDAKFNRLINSFISIYSVLIFILLFVGTFFIFTKKCKIEFWTKFLIMIVAVLIIELLLKEIKYYYKTGVTNSYGQFIIAKVTNDFYSFYLYDVFYPLANILNLFLLVILGKSIKQGN